MVKDTDTGAYMVKDPDAGAYMVKDPDTGAASLRTLSWRAVDRALHGGSRPRHLPFANYFAFRGSR